MRAAERRAMRRGERGRSLRKAVPPQPSPTDSWGIRSSLPGVFASDNIPTQAHFNDRLFYQTTSGADPNRKTYWDNVVTPGSGGSVRSYIPANAPANELSWDDYIFDFSTDLTDATRRYIVENQRVRIQWRMRFDQAWVDQNGGRAGGYISEWKNFVLLHGNNAGYPYRGLTASCPANQFTTVERHPDTTYGAPAIGFPTSFHACGQVSENYQGLDQFLDPGWGSDALVKDSPQNVRNLVNRVYKIGGGEKREEDPFPYYGDEWMTFMWDIQFGPYGTASDSVSDSGGPYTGYTNTIAALYLGREGEPLTMVHRQTGMVFRGYELDGNRWYIKSIANDVITTGTPHNRVSGNTVWIYDTLTSLDGNSYTVSDVGSATTLVLTGVSGINCNHGSMYSFNPGNLADEEQPDPSIGQGRFFLYPTGYEGNPINVAQEANIRCGEMIASTGVLPAPGYEPPAYVRAIAPGQVKQLTTAKAGGYAVPFSAFLAHPLYDSWDTVRPPAAGGPKDPAYHMQRAWTAWCGAAYDWKRHKLYVCGGGHDDSAWNGLAVMDFNSDDGVNPNGWSIADGSLSDANAVFYTTGAYADGKPTAIHSYDNLCFDAENQVFFRVGGSSYLQAGSTDGTWSFDVGPGIWTQRTNPISNQLSFRSLYDHVSNKVMLLFAWDYWVYDLNTHTWEINRQGHGGDWAGGQAGNMTGAFDYTRGRGIVCGFDANLEITWDRTDNSCTSTSLAAPSALSRDGPCGVYDHNRDCFWWYPIDRGGSGPTIGANTLYRLDGETLTWTTHTLTGDLPDLPPFDNKGHYGRMCYLDGWDALGCTFAYDQNTYVIKLPEE